MTAVFGVLAAIFTLACYGPYIRDIVRGSTRPERASWTIWSALNCIALAAQIADGATHSIWLTVASTAGVFVIAGFSYRRGTGSFIARDIVALVIAAVGLVIWALTDNPVLALLVVIAVDAVGGLLTMVKAYREPDSETLATWVLAGIGGAFGLLAVGAVDASLLAYPVYITVLNAGVATLIILGRRTPLVQR